MYLTSSSDGADLLSAKAMQTIEAAQVAELMTLNVHVERPHETVPGVTIGELGGPLYELVKLIAVTLNETGERLVRMGYPNLGSFVAEALKGSGKAGSGSDGNVGLGIVLERVRFHTPFLLYNLCLMTKCLDSLSVLSPRFKIWQQ